MESNLRIAFLTTEDPIYLPAFFEKVLAKYGRQSSYVFSVPPLYHEQTIWQAFWRYFQTFGWQGVLGLTTRVMWSKLRQQSIANVCKQRKVKFEMVDDVNAPSFIHELERLQINLVVSVSCPQLFKNPLINLPSLGCLNIHGAILPHYRGIMPSFWMMVNGETQAGVSIYYVNEKIDAGDLCGQRVFDIRPDETLHCFLYRSKGIAADLLLDVLRSIERGTITRELINLSEGSYYSWPNADDVRRFRENGRKLW